jgi:hypothetical protein
MLQLARNAGSHMMRRTLPGASQSAAAATECLTSEATPKIFGSRSSAITDDTTTQIGNIAAGFQEACELAALEQVRRRVSLVPRPQAPSRDLRDSLDFDCLKQKFHENRWRLWTGEPRNEETVQPFAQLHLAVDNIMSWDSASTKLIRVFVNDVWVGQSSTTDQQDVSENFRLSFGIYSPLSIVRISVWEHAFVNHSMIGFVEFRVSDLEPDGQEVSGYFELRRPEKFRGHADSRFQKHMQTRDDGANDRCSMQNRCSISRSNTSLLKLISGRSAPSMLPREQASDGKVTRSASDDVTSRRRSSNEYEKERSSQANAGEILVRLSLRYTADNSHVASRRHPSWLSIILSALSTQCLNRLCLPDEWHAYCFPRPRFTRSYQSEDRLYLKDIKDVHDELLGVRDIFLDQVIRKFAAMFLYVFSWKSRPLSFCILLYWWVCCLFPLSLLPALPLWVATWLKLLRDPRWRKDLLVHEATAPLNEEGFKMVAAFNSSEHLCIWLQRLINDHGGTVKDSKELAEFAKLTFRDGKPALLFQRLLSELKEKRWIAWHAGKERRCSEGHALELWGSGSYQLQHVWCCQVRSRDCLVNDRARIGLHLGVSRYHCRHCKLDFCKRCTIGENQSSILSTVPMLGLESLKDMVVEAQDVLKKIRVNAVTVLHHIERVLEPDATACAWIIYTASLIMSVVLAVLIIFSGDCLIRFIHMLFQILFWLLGTAALTQSTPVARRMVTVCRANWEFLAAGRRRAEGGCESWAFYTPLSSQSKALHVPA